MSAFDLLHSWPVDRAAAGWVTGAGRSDTGSTNGADADTVFPIASVTKPLVALAILIAIEEGTMDLELPAGPDGSTVRHLLAHASGLGPETADPVVVPGHRRIYSNAGFELLGRILAERSAMDCATYVHEAIVEPLGLSATSLTGSPAHGAASSVSDLLRIIAEFLNPHLIHRATLEEATSPQFPLLDGVLPGYGLRRPNPWGLGVEIKGAKQPHWTAAANSQETFGHFGRAGTFLWVDPIAGVGCVALADRDFGPWAKQAWPAFGDAVLAAQ